MNVRWGVWGALGLLLVMWLAVWQDRGTDIVVGLGVTALFVMLAEVLRD